MIREILASFHLDLGIMTRLSQEISSMSMSKVYVGICTWIISMGWSFLASITTHWYSHCTQFSTPAVLQLAMVWYGRFGPANQTQRWWAAPDVGNYILALISLATLLLLASSYSQVTDIWYHKRARSASASAKNSSTRPGWMKICCDEIACVYIYIDSCILYNGNAFHL